MTKPNSAEIPFTQLGELNTFIDLEFDNAEFLISILAKLSRKFAEPNVYTQSKALLALHSLFQRASEEAKISWCEAIKSMREEFDQKLGIYFFSMEVIEAASTSADTVLELQLLAVNRLYSVYVFKAVDLHLALTGSSTSSFQRKELNKVIKNMVNIIEVVEGGVKLERLLAEVDTPLTRQILSAVLHDRKWLFQQLKKLYELILRKESCFNQNEHMVIQQVEETLIQLNSDFHPESHFEKANMERDGYDDNIVPIAENIVDMNRLCDNTISSAKGSADANCHGIIDKTLHSDQQSRSIPVSLQKVIEKSTKNISHVTSSNQSRLKVESTNKSKKSLGRVNPIHKSSTYDNVGASRKTKTEQSKNHTSKSK